MSEDFFANKVVILAGAGGFIGSNLTDKLLELGAKVIGIDNFITGKEVNLEKAKEHENFQLQKIDLNDQAALMTTLEQAKEKYGQIDVFLHFASPASVPGYQTHPVETYLVNSIATHNILAWLKANSPETRFLFASTSEVYGNPQVHPQVETYWGNVNPNGPRSCYDESKRLGETICGVFHRDFGMNTRIIRIFNTYGPRMDLDDGRILPQFIKQVKMGAKLTVYGDGSQTRSYCFVSDLVEGILRFVAADGLAGETVNLGNPGEFTVLETAKIVNEVMGRSEDMITFAPLPKDDPMRRQPDISKAKKLIDWEPVVPFADGLTQMLQFYGLLSGEKEAKTDNS
ncbi:SDR family NAD(P)-dependent oxidoreductase [bacterium]|nr:SDR family NAD(P)-dependent oxidoreductase [bacterium]